MNMKVKRDRKLNLLLIFILLIFSALLSEEAYADRFFKKHSTWYEPIPANATIHPESAKVIADFNQYAGSIFIQNTSRPVFVADDAAIAKPTKIIIVNKNCDPEQGQPECSRLKYLGYSSQKAYILAQGWNVVPIPSNAITVDNDAICNGTMSYADNQMLIYSKDMTTSWSMKGAVHCANGSWYANKYNGGVGGWFAAVSRKFTNTSDGVEIKEGCLTNEWWPGKSGPSTQYDYLSCASLAKKPWNHGMLTYDEVVNDTIDHALEFVTWGERYNANGYWGIYPAVSYGVGNPTTSSRPYAPIAGMRFQLNPSFDIDGYITSRGLSVYHKRVLRALQKYGMIFVDAWSQGNGTGIYAELLKNAGSRNHGGSKGWGTIFTGTGSPLSTPYFPGLKGSDFRVIQPLMPPFNTSSSPNPPLLVE